MKMQFVAALSLFALPAVALADDAANDVFVANVSRGVVEGVNPVKNSPCSFLAVGDEYMGEPLAQFHYSFSSAEEPVNSISPGHFKQQGNRGVPLLLGRSAC